MSRHFKHSGDIGDMIYSLPTIRALGGGVLFLDPDGGAKSPHVKIVGRSRTKMTRASIDAAISLLKLQPYIEDVRHWNGEEVDHDLDQFRQHFRFNNLADSHLAAFDLQLSERGNAWITVDRAENIPGRPIVVARNVRYHGNDEFWDANLGQFKDKAIFVGHPKEHELFVFTFGQEIPFHPTPDLLSLARVLPGCEQFIGNEGVPRAIAEGLKLNLICESNRVCPNTIFTRPGAKYV